MAGRLAYGKRYRYPHLIQEDIRVWERFMEKYPGRFETVDYDFRVGQGTSVPGEWGNNMMRMARMLSQKRIDVIGWIDEDPTIIEIKSRVGLSALGQVLGYRTLFVKYFPNFPRPKLMVVCERISGDDLTVLKGNGIPVFVV